MSENNEWLNELAVLVDNTPAVYLININLKLHGSNKLFTNLCNDDASFKMKLNLFGKQLSGKSLTIFNT